MLGFFGQKAFRAVGHRFSVWMAGEVRTAGGESMLSKESGSDISWKKGVFSESCSLKL